MYNENLMIKIPKELKEQIKNVAEKQFQTVSDYVRSLIIKDIQERE